MKKLAPLLIVVLIVGLAFWLGDSRTSTDRKPEVGEPRAADRSGSPLDSSQPPELGLSSERKALADSTGVAAVGRRAVFHVRVTDLAGRPIEDARLVVVDGSRSEERRTDADGRAELEAHDGEPMLELDVDASGFAHVRALAYAGDHRIRLHRATPFAGRVLDAATREPIDGARVVLQHDHCRKSCEPEPCLTASSGSYSFASVVTGTSSSFRIEAEGYPMQTFTFELDLGQAPHDFLIERGHRIRGRVVDFETGLPIADARIDSGELTDTEGRFEFRMPGAEFDGSVGFTVRVSGYCAVDVRMDAEELAEPFDVRLPRRAILEGRVSDTRGEAVVGADVRLELRGRPRSEPTPLDDYPPRWRVYSFPRQARTLPQGSFSIETLPWASHYTVVVRKAGYRQATVPAPAANPGQTRQVELVLEALPAGGAVFGRVTLNGEPCHAKLSAPGDPDVVAVTDAAGAYRIEHPGLGIVELLLQVLDPPGVPELAGSRTSLQVGAGEEVRHDFDLVVDWSSVAGRVTRSGGDPVAGQRVDLLDAAGSFAFSAECDGDGRYRFQVAERPAGYSVELSHGDATLSRPAFPGDTDVDFVLIDLGTLRVRALDAASGEPISVLEVWWRPVGERLFQGGALHIDTPDPAGWQEARIPAGPIELLFRADELAYRGVLISNQALAAEGRLDVEAHLERGLAFELVLAPGMAPFPADHRVVLVEAESWDRIEAVPRAGGRPGLRPTSDFPDGSLYTRDVTHLGPSPRLVGGYAPGVVRFKAFPDDLLITPAEITLDEHAPEEPVEVHWSWK